MFRILDIGGSAATLRIENAQLRILLRDGAEESTPLSEIAALVISEPSVIMTQAVLAGVAENSGVAVVCDRKRLPVAMMLPLQSHSVQTERFARQVASSLPTRKRLWQQIVSAKIGAQSRLLSELHGDDFGLAAMCRHVRSGDAGGLEAQAAQRYWPRLFSDHKFRRGREGPDQNAHLNYGYAILRALVARAICAAGLHPSFGLQHHNRYDAFCLASDLMEPYRPLIDRAVWAWIQDHDPTEPLDKISKAWILQPLVARYLSNGEARSLFDWLARCASSLGDALCQQGSLEIPVL